MSDLRKINDKVKYRIMHEQAHLYAKLKGRTDWLKFATCHPATIPLLKADGIQKHSHLLRLIEL